jgi:hypothetical protein
MLGMPMWLGLIVVLIAQATARYLQRDHSEPTPHEDAPHVEAAPVEREPDEGCIARARAERLARAERVGCRLEDIPYLPH